MKKNIIFIFLFAIITGCSTLIETLNLVPTFNSKNNQEKEDWASVKIIHTGTGSSKIYAYKSNANPVKKAAASHINNQYKDALLFPTEENFIVLLYRNGSRVGTTIFNNVSASKNATYTIHVIGEGDKFTAKLVDENEKVVPHKITLTP